MPESEVTRHGAYGALSEAFVRIVEACRRLPEDRVVLVADTLRHAAELLEAEVPATARDS